MHEHAHDPILVIASLAVALMAGFTGLTLTRGAAGLPVPQRKAVVAMSAIVLGGGVWSMHFVAMLGLRLPVPFYYDALTTMISALTAILIVGLGLMLMHFGARSPRRILVAGVLVGVGIPAMHYIGMSGMRMAIPVYTVAGIAVAVAISIALSVAAFWLAYAGRDLRNILSGTLVFGVAVFALHFVAMAGTSFVPDPGARGGGPGLDNATLAFGVTLAAFLISAAFIMTGVTFNEAAAVAGAGPVAAPVPSPEPPGVAEAPPPPSEADPAYRIPYEREGRIRFVGIEDVAAIRAEGHYTVLYFGDSKALCPWSISESARRLPGGDMIRTHRSYIVNRRHVSGFERKKDTGVVFFEDVPAIAKAPVSRARLNAVRDHLGL